MLLATRVVDTFAHSTGISVSLIYFRLSLVSKTNYLSCAEMSFLWPVWLPFPACQMPSGVFLVVVEAGWLESIP